MKSLFRLLLALVLWLGVSGEIHAAALKVGVTPSLPFVISKEGVWSGLSVDIWEKVAAQNKWEYEYVEFPDVDTAVAAVTAGKIDVAIMPIPITSEAMKTMEFSQPYFRSGLQIMVSEAREHSFARLVEDFKTWGRLKIFWAVVAVVLAMTVVVALFERKHNADFPKKWGEGMAEAFYYVVSLALTGKSTYKGFPGVLGRLVLVAWMIMGMVMVIFLTSTITATMTAEKLQSQINDPKDLNGKSVGAIRESRAAEYLKANGISTTLYPSIVEAADGLVKGETQAVVGAAPVLQYYDFNNPNLPITEVGKIFKAYNYGFAFPLTSDRRLGVNAALLKLQESGEISDLAQKYFGSVYQP